MFDDAINSEKRE